MEGTKEQVFEYYGNKSMDLSFSDCARIAHEFINSELNGNIELLKDFSFYEYYDGSVHCDSMNIVKVFYVLLWGNKHNSEMYLDGFDYSNFSSKYGGDTINTFNTLFGGSDLRIANYWLEKFGEKKEIFVKIKEFEKTVYSLGNFTFLPKKTFFNPNVGKKHESINTYRGVGSGWRDYYDIFLAELEKCYNPNSTNKNYILNELYELNKDIYFSKIDTYEKFIRFNMLGDFDLTVMNFDEGRIDWLKDGTSQRYNNFINGYMDKVSDFIHKRAKRMISNLEIALRDFNA